MPLGAVLTVLWYTNPWLIGPWLLPMLLIQFSFRTLTAWRHENQRNRELAQRAQQLTHRLERLQDAATAMIASLNPEQMVQTVSDRLSALLGASASWVVLLDTPQPRIIGGPQAPSGHWDAAAYTSALANREVCEISGDAIGPLHAGLSHTWQSLVLIPLAREDVLLGAICLAHADTIALAEDDRRVLLAFATQAALAMEHARLFAALQHNQNELIRSSKLAALGTFSAGIGHEFNNLLAGIMGFAELGLQSSDIDDKNEALSVALRACKRGRSITSGLLTFARRSEVRISLHALPEIIDETLLLVERDLAKANITLVRHYHDSGLVLCDPGQIAQVLINLITNARDAMIEHGSGELTISLEQQGEWVSLAVSDTGTGIPEELFDQVFQPFMTTKGALGGSAVPGTGLGLAICHGIIQSHGGSIHITSAVGHGTTMTVLLPAPDATAPAPHMLAGQV
jgi:signal transduction histidine kinase